MCDRATELGGRVEAGPTPSGGRVTAWLPLNLYGDASSAELIEQHRGRLIEPQADAAARSLAAGYAEPANFREVRDVQEVRAGREVREVRDRDGRDRDGRDGEVRDRDGRDGDGRDGDGQDRPDAQDATTSTSRSAVPDE
jgi:hypothetical protein